MSIWTLIVSGLRTSATLRAVLRQCSRMEVASCADEGETGVDGDRVLIGVPENCELKIPLPAPCRARFVPCFRRQKAPCSAHHERRGFNTYFIDKKRLIGDECDKISNPAGVFGNFLPAVRDSSGARVSPSH